MLNTPKKARTSVEGERVQQIDLEKLREITVLYCEDEHELLEVTTGILERIVKKIYTAADGIKGLDLYRRHADEIDIVISDISMPQMDGLEMTRHIKKSNPSIPIIITTAYSSAEHLLEAIDIHVDKYVIKPLDTQKLLVAMYQSLLYHELRKLYRDPLTGLLTRSALLRDLQKQQENRLVLVDIAYFSHINDLYGDETGNQVLIAFSKLLSEAFQERYILYRIGVDSFILFDQQQQDDIDKTKEQLEAFAKLCKYRGMVVDGIPIYLLLTFAMAHSDDGHTLYYVQRALQKAHRTHRFFVEYDPQTDHCIDRDSNIRWAKALDSALASGRFKPYFQPIVETRSKKIHKYEALIRYIDERGEIVEPTAFLDIAAKAQLYFVIIRVMLQQVIDVIQRKKIRVAINLSYADLVDPETLRFIETILQQHPEEAKLLEFEILESEKMDNYRLAGDFIRTVRPYGCLVGIDDFGTGYANFSMLEALHVDYVKINGSLIKDIHTSPRQRLIAETIHDFCHKLGIKTVAEMVSCAEEFSAVQKIGIDYIQGWYISKALPESAIHER